MDRTSREARTAGGSVIRVRHYAPGTAQPRHAHDRTFLSLVVRGDLEERVGRVAEAAGALSVVVKPAGVEHADAFGRRGAVTLQLQLSAADEANARAEGCRLEAWRWVHAPDSVRPLLGLLWRLREPADLAVAPPGDTLEELVVEAVASLDPPPPAGIPPRWLLRAREALDEGAISIHEVAESLGVHPVHLAREFRRHFGTSPSEHRRRGRVRRAGRLLADSAVPLADAALEAGFSDQAHMTRELRAAAGLTPRRLRRMAAAA